MEKKYNLLNVSSPHFHDNSSTRRIMLDVVIALLPVSVASVVIFGVKALFAGLLSSGTKGAEWEMLLVSAAMILLLCVVEYIYVTIIKRSSDRYLLTLMQPQREE